MQSANTYSKSTIKLPVNVMIVYKVRSEEVITMSVDDFLAYLNMFSTFFLHFHY